MTEDQFHRSVAQYLALVLKPPTIWTTIGHGGGGRVRGAQLKAKGVKPGWPDVLIMGPARNWTLPHVVGLELKTKIGRASAEQRAVAAAFEEAHAEIFFCRSIDDVERTLKLTGFI